jgi:hypothetical protein
VPCAGRRRVDPSAGDQRRAACRHAFGTGVAALVCRSAYGEPYTIPSHRTPVSQLNSPLFVPGFVYLFCNSRKQRICTERLAMGHFFINHHPKSETAVGPVGAVNNRPRLPGSECGCSRRGGQPPPAGACSARRSRGCPRRRRRPQATRSARRVHSAGPQPRGRGARVRCPSDARLPRVLGPRTTTRLRRA